MEVKHGHNIHLSLSLLPSFPSSHCCCFKSWINSKVSFKKQFKGLAELWRFHILEMSKSIVQCSNKLHSAHLIKEKSILNFRDQLLKIPTFSPADYQLIKNNGFHSIYQQERPQGSVGIIDGYSKEKPFIMLTAHGLPHVLSIYFRANSTGYFLVLASIIAFCITCIIGAFHARIPKDKECEAFDESRRHHHQPRSMRWKHALNDINEPDNLDSESRPDSDSTSEDEDQNLFEDMSHAYSKVEHDYQKFLSECGISKLGYWRGGIHQ